jgi:hypothetical protein
MRPTDKELALVSFGTIILILVLELLSNNHLSASDILAALILGLAILVFMRLGYALRRRMFPGFDQEPSALNGNTDRESQHARSPRSDITWLTMQALMIPILAGIVTGIVFGEPLLFGLGLILGIAGAAMSALVWRRTAERNNH